MKSAIKVLIVDDDKASAHTLSEIVKRLGFKPLVSHKAVEALNMVRLQTVHAAIVDVLLPKMTGTELVSEFRNTKFADQPVILVSGVFKDKSFATEALRKTGALDFLFKPFNNEELIESLTKALQHLTNQDKWSVQSLLTRKLSSDRDRAKAIEHLDQINGLDFPFVLSILMEAGSSGNLNIVNDAGEIFGISLTKGTIANVDSTESQSTGVLALISKGYLSQEDWEEYQKSGKRFSLEHLVDDGYVSPHAIFDARREQILFDFRAICSSGALQVNFVAQDMGDEIPRHAVKLVNLMDLLRSSLDEFFPMEYLQSFYTSVKASPIRLIRPDAEVFSLWSHEVFDDPAALKAAVRSGDALESALTGDAARHAKIYQCLHYLVLNRAVMFDDLSLTKSLNTLLDRYTKLYAELKELTPDKIFEYFGVKNTSNSAQILSTYEEFVKSNNPNQLPKDAAPELRDLCEKCYLQVSHAKDILTDEAKKIQLFNELKTRATEKQQKAQQLMNEGLEKLRNGQAKDALVQLKEAEELHPNVRLRFISIWAEIKSMPQMDKARLQELAKSLDQISSDDRKSPFYYMALGMVKKALGDPTAAQMFEKALQLDSEFVDARRELNSKQNANARAADKKLNIFQDDITQVVSQIFRRKAD